MGNDFIKQSYVTDIIGCDVTKFQFMNNRRLTLTYLGQGKCKNADDN